MTLSPSERAALSDLVHRYAAYVDDREFDSVAELFTDDAELSVPEPPADLQPIHSHRGQQAITTAVAAVAAVARTEHAIIGEVYDAAARPGTARGRIACVAHHWNERDDELVDVVGCPRPSASMPPTIAVIAGSPRVQNLMPIASSSALSRGLISARITGQTAEPVRCFGLTEKISRRRILSRSSAGRACP